MQRAVVWLFFFGVACPAFGQAVAEDPPAGTTPIAGEELRARLAGKVFTYTAPTAKGAFRVQYDANGYAFINGGSGQGDSGKWRVEGNKACTEWKVFPSSCSEVRARDDVLLVKRSDGSWGTLTPR